MIDHVTIRVPDLEQGRAFYGRALELVGGPPPEFDDWGDFSLGETDGSHPVTERLHIAFRAESTEAVDQWWRAMTELGPSAGEPGRRPQYSPDYYGAFVLDAAENSVEAMTDGPRKQPGVLDHLWLRTRDLEAMSRFYEAVCPAVAHEVELHEGRTTIRGDGATFSIVEGPPTVGLHLAFAAPDQATVDAFHRAGVEAGYPSNGAPGERPEYHPGYYGAFLLDPDSHNIEAVYHDRDDIND